MFQFPRKYSFPYLKGVMVFFLIGWVVLSLSCTSPTGSSTSSGSGTGTGWRVTVSANPTSISSSNAETSGILVVVKDESNTPAPSGTSVCVSAQRGGFVSTSGTDSTDTIPVSACESISNNVGQMQVTYISLKTWNVEVSPGVFQKLNLPIGAGPDTITATALGATGSKTIQIID